MQGTTNKYRNIHRLGTGSVGDPPKSPEPSITEARSDLLVQHHVPLPPRGTANTAALYRFIDGEPLSRKDCLQLSAWLETAGVQNADLLAAMQGVEPSFVFVLNLTRPPHETQNLIHLLMDVCDRDLTYGLSMRAVPPESLAHVVRGVMTIPQSRVTRFRYLSPAIPRGDTKAILQHAITGCPALERVEGHPSLLMLLQRSVPEIQLAAYQAPSDEVSVKLLEVLRMGKVEKLTLTSDVQAAHQWVAEAVANANAQLSPDRSVHQVDLNTFARQSGLGNEAILAPLLLAPHLKALTLPSTSWIVTYDEGNVERWNSALRSLQWLQSLAFHSEEHHRFNGIDLKRWIEDTIAMLGPVLERNKQRSHFGARMAAAAMTCTVADHLLKDEQKGLSIDPLDTYLAQAFAGTNTAQALTVLSRSTAAAAAQGRDHAERLYKQKLVLDQAAASQSRISGTSPEPSHPREEERQAALQEELTRRSRTQGPGTVAEAPELAPIDLNAQPLDVAELSTLVQGLNLDELFPNADASALQPRSTEPPPPRGSDKT